MLSNDLLHYNALDAACTEEARQAFWPELSRGYQWAYDRTIELFPVLMAMMNRGIAVDLSELGVVQRLTEQRIQDAQLELNRLAGRELNPNSPKQVQQYFYIEKGCQPYYKDGAVTTDDKAMQRLARPTSNRRGFPEAALIQELRGLIKLKGTYLEIEFDKDQRLRCAINPRGTKYGRLSTSQTIYGTGMNMQNLPPAFKRFCIADPGYFLIEVDKRQAEWVVVAYLANDANMIKVVEEGLDPHTYTGSLMYNVPQDIILLDNKVVGNSTDAHEILATRQDNPQLSPLADRLPRTMSGRQAGKKSNHGLNYDEGYRTFALTNEMPEHEGKTMVNKYHTIYPGVRATFHKYVQSELGKSRTLTNCFGRKMSFLDAWGDTLFKAAYASLPQSTVVDGLNRGMIDVHDSWICDRNGLNADTLAQVHDSVLYQIPMSVLSEPRGFKRALDFIFTACEPPMHYNGRSFVIQTDAKVGFNWGKYGANNPRGMKDVDPDNLQPTMEYLQHASEASK